MSQMIGFDRKIKLDWLDTTVGLCQQNLDPDSLARQLEQQLEAEIAGSEARRKTVTVLLRLWVKVPETDQCLRDEALGLIEHITPSERLWVHWGMSLLAYPFFCDVAATIGQLGHLQGTFGLAQIQRRMVEGWGERTTLRRAIQRLMRTFFEWQVLQEAEGKGNYAAAASLKTDNPDLALWLLTCALHAHRSEQVLLRELVRLPYIFPFDLLPFVNNLRHAARFEVMHQGLDMEMVALSSSYHG